MVNDVLDVSQTLTTAPAANVVEMNVGAVADSVIEVEPPVQVEPDSDPPVHEAAAVAVADMGEVPTYWNVVAGEPAPSTV